MYVSIVEGSFNAETFATFIDGLLNKMNPYPEPNSVIVMDNCRIHKSETIREMIEERCVRLSLFVTCFLNCDILVGCAASIYLPTPPITILWSQVSRK